MLKKMVILFYALLGISLTIIFFSVRLSMSGPKQAPTWSTDLNAVIQRRNVDDRPLLLEFNATWCGPCQRMKTTTLLDPQVVRALGRYILVSIDIDAHPDLAAQLHVETIPRFLIIDSKTGRVLKENLDGAKPPEDFLGWLDSDNDPRLDEIFPGFGDQSLSTTR